MSRHETDWIVDMWITQCRDLALERARAGRYIDFGDATMLLVRILNSEANQRALLKP